MTIGEVAKRSGLRTSAIRYYERVGLLPKPIRKSGQRRYDPRILRRLAVLARAKNCGFTLAEARQLFEEPGSPSERWDRVSKTKVVELDALLARIQRMKSQIVRRCECADLDECGRRLLAKSGSQSCST
ncbi:MAG TPA: MerR family transcriptional regulator [Bryobacteraceae bacterium]|nr:MerR family transcriptional regulator [Bryobacteraceae bacterium]